MVLALTFDMGSSVAFAASKPVVKKVSKTTAKNQPKKKSEMVIQGFLIKVKDSRTVAIDTGKHIYFLKRKQTYLKNQLAFRQPANKRVSVKVTAADVYFRTKSLTKKQATQAL